MSSSFPKSIGDNLRFLIVEVSTQVSNLQSYITRTDSISAAHILDRSGYTANLKSRLHHDCYQHMSKTDNNVSEIIAYRSIDSIAINLERITELCRDCTHHVSGLEDKNCPYLDDFVKLLDRIALSTSLIERATLERNSQQALKIGDTQHHLGNACLQLIEKHNTTLKSKKNTDGLISSLFVVKSIKSMGDALLKICEAILSGNMGQAITLNRFHSLTDFVGHLQKKNNQNQLSIEPLAETRSGSAISGISNADTKDTDIIAVFKDGKKRKLKEELQSVENWNKIYPGIAPKILSYQKKGQSASMLIEHLEGKTFESILLEGSYKLQKTALKQIGKTLIDIWQKTRRNKPVNGQFMEQLQKRLGDVYAIHPGFKQENSKIAGLSIPAFDTLVKHASELEQHINAPFSVHIHGDFNSDNIMIDPQNNKINFIDLHRSRKTDYVQDVSVFMVSNYRLTPLGITLNQRVLQLNLSFYQFIADYARQNQDISFDVRLALGLARSLATSTRFTLDKSLAKAMFYRSRYLIEQVLNLKTKHYPDYRTPIKEIFLG